MSEQQNLPRTGESPASGKEHTYQMGTYQLAPGYSANQAGTAASHRVSSYQQVPMREEIRELPYHRLAFADAKNRWWKPLAEGALGGLVYLLLSIAFAAVTMLALHALYPEISRQLISLDSAESSQDALINNALSNPLVFVILFGSVALMFPVLWGMRLIFGPKPWGLIHSVVGRIRWSWLFISMGVAFIFYAVVPTILDYALGNHYEPNPGAHGADLVWMVIILLLVVPIQCYAEELVFRGYLMQSIGRWLKHPAWAILLPAPLFMIGHTQYELWGLLSVLVMGFAAGYLAWYTGGLESGIGLHVVNNLMAMGFGIFGLADPFLQDGGSFATFAVSLVTELLFVGAIVWLARRRGIERVRPVRFYVPAPELAAATPVSAEATPSSSENLQAQKNNPENPEQ